MSALHSVLRDRLHHAENVVEGAQRAYDSALEEAREAGIEVPEPAVQVPVKSIENIDRDLGENAWHPEDCPGSHPAYCTCAVGKARRELRALLSQPTPTAVLTGGIGYPVHEAARREDEHARNVATAAPPSIADMVPGTTFWARTRDGVLSTLDRFWMVADNGWVFSTEAHHLNADRIDPSTIRDVTPPKEQP